MIYKTILDILTTRKKNSTMTGFEPGPTARELSMITARLGDLFWNCMQSMGLMCRAYNTQWTIHRTVHNKKSSCSLFSTKWTNFWYWICDIQASFILTGYLFEEINRIKSIFERFTMVKWNKKMIWLSKFISIYWGWTVEKLLCCDLSLLKHGP